MSDSAWDTGSSPSSGGREHRHTQHVVRTPSARSRPRDEPSVQAEARRDARAQVLDWLSVGALLVDARGKILLVNRAADRILRERDGLFVKQGRPCGALRRETAELHRLIAVAVGATKQDTASITGTMTLSRGPMRKPLGIRLVPLRAAAIVLVSDPARCAEAPVEALARLYGLTPAEARLVRGLVAGASLDAVADTLGIAKETARVHLRQAFTKTDTHRQAELVTTILSDPVFALAGESRFAKSP